MKNFVGLFKKNWPIIAILFITFIFFWKFFLKGLVPIPADIIPGTYLPWFDLRFPYYPAGIPVKNNVLSDVVSIIYPWRELAINLMKQGIAPLWNPYILSGNFLLANFQSAPFYTLNIVYWLIPDFSNAWSMQVILQPLMAALFMYLFLRNSKLSKLPSLFGSLVWGFSGFFMVWLEYNLIVHAALYFPLILYSIQKSVENKKFYLLLSLAISLSFYAGYPQITLYELIFAGIFALFVARPNTLKNYTSLIFYVLLGIGLSMPFLLPGYEAAKDSIRQVDNVATMSHVKFILPKQVITFIAPDYFGNPTSRNYWLIDGAYENAILFAGGPAFILFLISFFIDKKYRSKLLYYSWITFFIATILAFRNPISEFLGNSKILLFSSSVMGRLAMLIMFAFAVSTAIVMDLIIKGKLIIKKTVVPIVITAVLIIVYVINGFLINNSVALRNLILPVLMFLMGSCLIIVAIKSKKFKYFLFAIFILLEMFDLFRFHDKYNPFIPAELLYPNTVLTNFMASRLPARFESEDAQIMPPNMWMPYGLYSASGQDAQHSLRYNKFLGFVNTGKFQPGDRYTRIVNYNSKLFDFLAIENIVGVKWKNGSPDFEGKASYKFDNPKFKKVFDDGRSLVLKNSKAFPRIFAVGSYVIANTDEEFSKAFVSIDLSNTVILEEDPNIKFKKGDVNISNQKFSALQTSFETESKNDTFVILSQSYTTDWKAYIDNDKAKLFRANYDFMGVFVPEGSHKIFIKYEPFSFRLGLIIGGVSAICLVFLLFYMRVYRRDN